LPPSIIDQIKLWEIEKNRLQTEDSALYNQFLSQTDYEVVRDHAQEIGVLIYANDQKRTVIVTRDGHEPVKKFWKKHSKKLEGSS
jgi:transcription initiation factor TFIIH subunit 4